MAETPRWREERARVFFALWPDASTAKVLHGLADATKQRFGGRAMRIDTLHLTLAFIGGMPRVRLPELLAIGAAVAPRAVDLSLDVLGEWSRKHIVWAGPERVPEPLAALAAELQSALVTAGFALEARPFVPHVTLLRNAACATHRTPLEPPVCWRADGFVLVESKLLPSGARYEMLGRWHT
ncbi:MAG: RNA 2',3'-cyclic phosphodiesterase [Zoogloeaceae bacterium]|nr:RNA 2',3'-cyclic phosphodiesterase [Zoogloeaceae bacterium]